MNQNHPSPPIEALVPPTPVDEPGQRHQHNLEVLGALKSGLPHGKLHKRSRKHRRALRKAAAAAIPAVVSVPIPEPEPVPSAPKLEFIQIQPALATQPAAKLPLPFELIAIGAAIYGECSTALDKQIEAIELNDSALLKEAHSELRTAEKRVRKEFCNFYHYPFPEANNRREFIPWCDSGRRRFYTAQSRCTKCFFFDARYMPEREVDIAPPQAAEPVIPEVPADPLLTAMAAVVQCGEGFDHWLE